MPQRHDLVSLGPQCVPAARFGLGSNMYIESPNLGLQGVSRDAGPENRPLKAPIDRLSIGQNPLLESNIERGEKLKQRPVPNHGWQSVLGVFIWRRSCPPVNTTTAIQLSCPMPTDIRYRRFPRFL
jgi:hypothetical protein